MAWPAFPFMHVSIAILLAISLGACGGGGGNGGSMSPPPMTPEEDQPPPPPPEEDPPENFDTQEFRESDGLDNINALPAFESGGSGAGVMVGVVDTGVDTDQPDLDANISPLSTDVVRADEPLVDGDQEGGHGTIVSGIIAAERNNRGVMGVAFESTILMARAEQTGSCEDECTFSDGAIARGIRHAVDNGARVVNVSLGGESFGPAVQSAVQDAAANDVVVVISAGNDGEVDPGGFAQIANDDIAGDNIIIVGASAQDDTIADFSNRAGNLQASFLVAPGQDLTSTVPQDFCDPGPGICVGFGVAGTSFSAPHVTGAVAVLAQLFPALTGPEIREILFESARDLGDAGIDDVFGHGLLDLGAAVQPIGTTSMPTSEDGGTSETMTGSGMATSAAFGDALADSGLLDGVLMTDRFDRTFRVDLSDGLQSVSGAFRVAGRLVTRSRRVAAGSKAVGKTGRFGFSAYAAPEAAIGDSLSAYRRARIAQPDPVIEFSGRIDGQTDFALSRGIAPARLLERARPIVPSGALAISSRVDTPFLSPTRRAQAMRIGRRLSARTRLDLAVVHAARSGDERAHFDPLRARSDSMSLVAQLGTRIGPLDLSGRMGTMIEDGAVLGARSGGVLDLGGGARSHFVGVDAAVGLSSGWRLFGRAVLGRTEAAGRSSGLIDSLGALESRAFSAGLSGRGVFRSGDRLTFAAAQPLRITGGELAVKVPVERDFETRNFIFETRRRTLSPSGREIDLEVGYRMPLARDLTLESNLLHQMEPGHIADSPSVTSLMLRLRAYF